MKQKDYKMKPQTKKEAEYMVVDIHYQLLNLPRLSLKRRRLKRQAREIDKEWKLGLFKYIES